MQGGIAKTAKFYYMVLAVCDIGKLALSDMLTLFLDYGLQFLTRGQFYFSAPASIPWACHIIHGLFYFFPHIINWTLLLLNLERVFIVMFPLHARTWFSIRSNLYYLLFVVILGVVMTAVGGKVANAVSSPILGTNQCLTDKSEPAWWISFRVVITIDLYIGPNIVSLICALIIIFKIRKELLFRASLTMYNSRNSILFNASGSFSAKAQSITKNLQNRNVSLSQISGALIAAIMAFVHAVFYLPDAVFCIIWYQTLGSTDVVISSQNFMLFFIFTVFTCLDSLSSFIIYTVGIPSFKEKLCNRPSSKRNTFTSDK